MSAQNDPPLTRREARRRQQLAEEAAAANANGPDDDRVARPEPAAVGSVSASSVASAGSAPVAPAAWNTAAKASRPRDFAPPSPDTSTRVRPSFADERPDEPLEYRTHGRPALPTEPPPLVEPAVAPRVESSPAPLSRRELRARRAAEQEAHDESASAPHASPAPEVSRGENAAVTEEQFAEPHAPERPDSSVTPPPAPVVLPGVAASPHAQSVGSHWSVGVHDDDDPFENTFSRQVGSAATSTNALVLPEMPRGNLTGPVAGTGEIIITGMIDVPSTVASTGAVPSVHDSPDIDDLFDLDTEYASTDSAPVSAISAVSSHTGTRDVMGGRKARRSGVLTTVLVGATVVMAVVAVGLFIVAAVNGLF